MGGVDCVGLVWVRRGFHYINLKKFRTEVTSEFLCSPIF